MKRKNSIWLLVGFPKIGLKLIRENTLNRAINIYKLNKSNLNIKSGEGIENTTIPRIKYVKKLEV